MVQLEDVINQIVNNGLALGLCVYLVVNQNTKFSDVLEQLTTSINTMSNTLSELKTEIELLKVKN